MFMGISAELGDDSGLGDRVVGSLGGELGLRAFDGGQDCEKSPYKPGGLVVGGQKICTFWMDSAEAVFNRPGVLERWHIRLMTVLGDGLHTLSCWPALMS